MFGRILIKDLKRRKGINIILLIFMILAVMFVASSVNNILVVSNATKYCLEKPSFYFSSIFFIHSTNGEHFLISSNRLFTFSKSTDENSFSKSPEKIRFFNPKSSSRESIRTFWSSNFPVWWTDKKGLLKIRENTVPWKEFVTTALAFS